MDDKEDNTGVISLPKRYEVGRGNTRYRAKQKGLLLIQRRMRTHDLKRAGETGIISLMRPHTF